MPREALLLIDIQKDFLPGYEPGQGSSLAVPHGNQVLDVANQLIRQFELVWLTQDWHPSNHLSFASQHSGRQVGDCIDLDGLQQVLWPDHCVQGSLGAEFCELLALPETAKIVQKGTRRRVDSYSGFFDNARKNKTELDSQLRAAGVEKLVIAGLATDYCVCFTALDAIDLGYETHLAVDGCRGVDMKQGDCDRAIEKMLAAGVKLYGK